MLYWLIALLNQHIHVPGMGVFNYITFRAVLAAVFSLIISLIIGKYIIRILRNRLIGESIRKDGPASHKSKAGTPTMGGIIIIASIAIPTLLWGDLSNGYVVMVLFATLWMGIIGFLDDYIKVFKKNKAGLKGKFKIFGQISLGVIIGLTMVLHPDFRGDVERVRHDNTLRINDYLTRNGFQAGDKLYLVGGRPVDRRLFTGEEKAPHFATYDVLRKTGEQTEFVQTINIEEKDRQYVSETIFGKKDLGFITRTNVPFFKDYVFNYANLAFWDNNPQNWSARIIYILVVIFIITAVSNGVNITDGLDGLAAGTTGIVAIVLGAFAYVSGNIIISNYLNITFIPNAGELLIYITALIGACLGFLWYNSHPAQVFMGDTGSLALGGAVGVLALMVKIELLLPLICGIFFVESLSVIIQVSYFRYTKRKYGEGKRIFKMAPLHHHYELLGWHESKIVTRFWIITILLELLALSTLKLR